MGRGRGNAFLNDLCDADSLIHVVDASGRSDSEGVDQGSSAESCLDSLQGGCLCCLLQAGSMKCGQATSKLRKQR